jgi:hypothetical protein
MVTVGDTGSWYQNKSPKYGNILLAWVTRQDAILEYAVSRPQNSFKSIPVVNRFVH